MRPETFVRKPSVNIPLWINHGYQVLVKIQESVMDNTLTEARIGDLELAMLSTGIIQS